MDTITIEATQLPVISTNFTEIRAALEQELQRYDVVVTDDTLADAKKLATDLNKKAEAIDRRRIEAVREVSKPIDEFQEQAKELAAMCRESRQKLVEQVKVFEAEKLATAREKLSARLEEVYDSQSVRDEYRQPLPEGAEKLSHLTATGNLAAAGMKVAGELAAQCLIRQQKIDMRLAALEGECLKAGLQSPITAEHVQGFIEAPDPDYDDRLARLIDVELSRQQQLHEAMQKQDEPASQEIPPEPPISCDEPEPQQDSAPVASVPAQEPQGQTMLVEIHLAIPVPPGTTPQHAEGVVRNKLKAAGVEKSVQSITARVAAPSTQAA